jgi:hypothetical protein
MFGRNKEAAQVRKSQELVLRMRGVIGPAVEPGTAGSQEGTGRWYNPPVYGPLASERAYRPANSAEGRFAPNPGTGIVGGTPLERGLAMRQLHEGMLRSRVPVTMYGLDLSGAGGTSGELTPIADAARAEGYQVLEYTFSPTGVMAGFGNHIDSAADLIASSMPSKAGPHPDALRAERDERADRLTEIAQALQTPYLDIGLTHDALTGLCAGGDNYGRDLSLDQIDSIRFGIYENHDRIARHAGILEDLRTYLGRLRRADPVYRQGAPVVPFTSWHVQPDQPSLTILQVPRGDENEALVPMAAATFTYLLDTPQPLAVHDGDGRVHVVPHEGLVGGVDRVPKRLLSKIESASFRPAPGRPIATRLMYTWTEIPADFGVNGQFAYASLGNIGEGAQRLTSGIGKHPVTIVQPNMSGDGISQSVQQIDAEIAPQHILDQVRPGTVTGVFRASEETRIEGGLPLYAMPGAEGFEQAQLHLRQRVSVVGLGGRVAALPVRAIAGKINRT